MFAGSDDDAPSANLAATTVGGELAAFAVRRGEERKTSNASSATLLGRALLTEGTFQHAFPDTSGSESRLGPFCMWRARSESRESERTNRAIARFAVAAAATGALCFVTLLRGDAEAESAAVARLDRVVSPHLPCLSRGTGESPAARARSVIPTSRVDAETAPEAAGRAGSRSGQRGSRSTPRWRGRRGGWRAPADGKTTRWTRRGAPFPTDSRPAAAGARGAAVARGARARASGGGRRAAAVGRSPPSGRA